MIAIIDYDAGNLKSVEKAFEALGAKTLITRKREEILAADHVVLPGVGSFGDAMERLNSYDLMDVLHQVVSDQIPLLGICLGMQVLFNSSEEFPDINGLQILSGKVLHIPPGEGLKIPHMGWNSLEVNPRSRLFKGIKSQSFVYFVHSYYLQADDLAVVAATTDYSVRIHAAVESGNVFGCQFHPEKSSETGLQILKNFINLG